MPEKIDSNFSQVDADDNNTTADEDISIIANPLIKPLKWHSELYRRIRLLPWWVKYNIGVAEAAVARVPDGERLQVLRHDHAHQ